MTAAQLEQALQPPPQGQPVVACVLLFAGTMGPNTLDLATTLTLCHTRGVPVVLDAAAQLPPISNLWHWTQLGYYRASELRDLWQIYISMILPCLHGAAV